MLTKLFIGLGLPLIETWCIEGIVFLLNFMNFRNVRECPYRKDIRRDDFHPDDLQGKSLPWRKMFCVFLLVNTLTNLPLNLFLTLSAESLSVTVRLIFLTLMEGALIPLGEAALYRKMLGLRSFAEWILISYEMNLLSYLVPIIIYLIKGGI